MRRPAWCNFSDYRILLLHMLLQVKALLSKVEDVDAIIDAVPYLMNPKELQQSLANLARWFPNQDPCACTRWAVGSWSLATACRHAGMLQKTPQRALSR
jgi:hypothetical protein